MKESPLNLPGDHQTQDIDQCTLDSMFEVFYQICVYWDNLKSPENHKDQLLSFMINRIRLRPEYFQYYQLAATTMSSRVKDLGVIEAYKDLFTNPIYNQPHNNAPLAITRQKVSNEFIIFQSNQGGTNAFGPKNSLGYISGAYISGQSIPYRSIEG